MSEYHYEYSKKKVVVKLTWQNINNFSWPFKLCKYINVATAWAVLFNSFGLLNALAARVLRSLQLQFLLKLLL